MKTTATLHLALLGLSFLLSVSFAQAQSSLGAYDTTIVQLGQSGLVTSDSTPSGLVYAVAYTESHFSGFISTDPISGNVRVTNASPAGTYTIKVQATDSAGMTIDTTFILIVTDPLCSHATFKKRTALSISNDPGHIAVADFNEDGVLDIVTTHRGANFVSIKYGDGLGGFTGMTTVPVSRWPIAVTVGDFNGDGKQDFATSNLSNGYVSVRLGNGAGSFSSKPDIKVGMAPNYITTGDFNEDGKQDLITANTQSNDVSVLIGDGKGGFTNTDTLEVVGSPNQIAIADFNGDGNQDFACSGSWNGGVSIRLGDGLGNLSHDTTLESGAALSSVAIGDFNSDGYYDLASTRLSRDKVYIWFGDEFGRFDSLITIKVGDGPIRISIGDFNGDGNQDISTSNSNSQDVTIALGNGLGSFNGLKTIPIGEWTGSQVSGDFNHDGMLDFAAVNSFADSITIQLGEPFPVSPAVFEACEDTAGSQLGIFDLRLVDSLVDVYRGNMVNYYLSQLEAKNDTNPISNPDGYLSSDSSLIWARVEDIWGCFGVAKVMLHTNPTPEIPSVAMGYEIFKGDTVPTGEGLTASCNAFAFWYNTPTGGIPIDSGPVFNPTKIDVLNGGVDANAVGKYPYYVACEANGCASARSQIDFEVSPNSSISGLTFNASFIFDRVFPNPARDQITLDFTLRSSDKVNIRLFNRLGQLIAERSILGKTGANQIHWNLPPLPSGVYQIEITHQYTSLSKKLVVIH